MALNEAGTLQEYVICSELHEDGNPHLHAYVKYRELLEFTPTRFDIQGYHGNYQVAKTKTGAINYVKKNGDFITNLKVKAPKKT